MDYTTVFDTTQQSYRWWLPTIGLLILATGIYSWVKREQLAQWMASYSFAPQKRTATNWVELVSSSALLSVFIGVCWACGFFALTFPRYATAHQILTEGQAAVVEGPVRNYTTSSGGKVESFTVDGIQFTYSEYSESVGFHKTRAFGGPISENLYVRIHWTEIEGDPATPVILKLETKQ